MSFSIYAQTDNQSEKKTKKIISATIDFYDYVAFLDNAKQGFYPLDKYEAAIKEMADAGIKKIYLRVNVIGFTLYPTKAGHLYGTEGGMHHGAVESTWMVNTLNKYDPVKETIRLGHKHGLQVWAWESLWDDACMYYKSSDPKITKLYGDYPMMDPFFRNHHDYYLKLNPRYKAQIQELNKTCRNRTISKIVFRGAFSPKAGRLKKSDLAIYISDDNKDFKEYTADYKVTTGRSTRGNNIITIDGLKISAPYVKLFHKQNFGTNPPYTLILSDRTNSCGVYDDEGKLIPATWGIVRKQGNLPDTPLNFTMKADFAWDALDHQIGFTLGKPDVETPEYFLGVSELAIPAVKEHKLAKFKEVTEYNFDGFTINLRSHGTVSCPEEYGYNQIIREKYLKRYGKDIWREDFDRRKWLDLRAESVDEFLAEAKKLTGGRPLYMTALKNRKPGDTTRNYYDIYGDLPWHYDKWIAAGSIDGVSMAGACFPEVFAPENNKGGKTDICMFYQIRHNPPVKIFKANIRKWLFAANVDEVELYESLHLTAHKKYLDAVKEILATDK